MFPGPMFPGAWIPRVAYPYSPVAMFPDMGLKSYKISARGKK